MSRLYTLQVYRQCLGGSTFVHWDEKNIWHALWMQYTVSCFLVPHFSILRRATWTRFYQLFYAVDVCTLPLPIGLSAVVLLCRSKDLLMLHLHWRKTYLEISPWSSLNVEAILIPGLSGVWSVSKTGTDRLSLWQSSRLAFVFSFQKNAKLSCLL